LKGWWEQQQNHSILELTGPNPSRQFIRLPRELLNLSRLTSLVLLDNGLQFLDPVLGQLIQLKTLSIGMNPLLFLPASINKLTNLTMLDLDTLPLTSLPEELFHLTQLEILKVRDCPISEIPAAIGKLQCLDWLRFNNTLIESLPDELFSLRLLTLLEISYNDFLSFLSPRLAELPKLHWLSLKSCPLIQSIPCELWKAPKLKNLNAVYNPQLKKLIREGGLGADYNDQKYTMYTNFTAQRPYETLKVVWQDIYDWRRKWPPIMVYLCIGLGCDTPILEAMWIFRPPVISRGFGTYD
jgi:Leucine-rich repeat (LRR) protein